MSGAYTPACPACRDNDRATFYRSCAGCQARKAAQQQPVQLTKRQVEGMDSTMQPLDGQAGT